MRCYKISCEYSVEEDDETTSNANHVVFAPSQGSAAAVRRDMMKEHGIKMAEVTIAEVDVPTSKAELIDYLNVLMNG